VQRAHRAGAGAQPAVNTASCCEEDDAEVSDDEVDMLCEKAKAKTISSTEGLGQGQGHGVDDGLDLGQVGTASHSRRRSTGNCPPRSAGWRSNWRSRGWRARPPGKRSPGWRSSWSRCGVGWTPRRARRRR
jgi:hypothetical protein